MLNLQYEIVNCQMPIDQYNIGRVYTIVKCTFVNAGEQKLFIQQKALELALAVNPGKANDATTERGRETLIRDALGGVLAEYGWVDYINRTYGQIASFTPFNGANGQIDILLNNQKAIEVRSSFPRNGIKFAICNNRYNFRNICKYENFYKPSEVNKDFFASVLFETQKLNITTANQITFYLIGGSTRNMMNSTLCYEADLTAEDDLTEEKTKYKVIDLKNALDMNGFRNYMSTLGYLERVCNS